MSVTDNGTEHAALPKLLWSHVRPNLKGSELSVKITVLTCDSDFPNLKGSESLILILTQPQRVKITSILGCDSDQCGRAVRIKLWFRRSSTVKGSSVPLDDLVMWRGRRLGSRPPVPYSSRMQTRVSVAAPAADRERAAARAFEGGPRCTHPTACGRAHDAAG